MTDAIGIDIIEIDRIRRAVERFGERFVERVLSPGERKIFDQRIDRFAFLAGRFAAKEAVVKALGRFLSSRPPWATIELLPDERGIPQVHVGGTFAPLITNLRLLVSIAHDRTSAVAVVTITED